MKTMMQAAGLLGFLVMATGAKDGCGNAEVPTFVCVECDGLCEDGAGAATGGVGSGGAGAATTGAGGNGGVPATVTPYYSRAYNLGQALQIGDLGLIDGDRHLVIRQDNAIVIIKVTKDGFTERARITDPDPSAGFQYWAPMLAVVPDVNGDNVNEIAAYARDASGSLSRFYMLSGNLPVGAVNTGDKVALYTLDFPSGDFLQVAVKPGGSEMVLSESAGFVRRRSTVDGKILHTVNLAPAYYHGALSWVGDVNIDGVNDYAVASEEYGSNSQLYLISGVDTIDGSGLERALFTLSEPSTLYLGYTSYNERNSNLVAAIGDANGDGIVEIAVGAPYGNSGGRVVVFDGALGTAYGIINGYFPGSYGAFGSNVVAPGDMDGDQSADLVVSDPEDIAGGSGFGSISGYRGVDGTELFRYYADAGETLGDGGMITIADLNGDGRPELAVGSSSNASIWLSTSP